MKIVLLLALVPTWIVDPNNPCGGMVPAQCHVFSMSYQVFFPLIGGSNE